MKKLQIILNYTFKNYTTNLMTVYYLDYKLF